MIQKGLHVSENQRLDVQDDMLRQISRHLVTNREAVDTDREKLCVCVLPGM